MSEPPPKPSRRPVRAPKDAQPAGADDFDFDVSSKPAQAPDAAPQRTSQSPAEHAEPGDRTESAEPENEPRPGPASPDAAPSREGSLPPRPAHRPPRPASRPIHIQPAPADPPHVRQTSELRAELEALDTPGAAADESTVQRFKDVEARLAEEGPGGKTAASLGFPALGPQKVPQSTPAPPPKPSTRPVRKPRSSTPQNESPAPEQETQKEDLNQDRKEENNEVNNEERERSSLSDDSSAFSGSVPKNQSAPSDSSHTEQSALSKPAPEKQSTANESALGNSASAEPTQESGSNQSTKELPEEDSHEDREPSTHRNIDRGQADDENKLSHDDDEAVDAKAVDAKAVDAKAVDAKPADTEPAEAKHAATKEVPAPAQHPVLNEEHVLRDADNDQNAVDKEPPLEADELQSHSHKASEVLDTKESDNAQSDQTPEKQTISDSEATTGNTIGSGSIDKHQSVDSGSSKFSEPEAASPPKSDVVKAQSVDVNPALSKEETLSADLSELRQSHGSDVHKFVEPAAVAPDDDSVPSSPKKRVAFNDAVTNLSTREEKDPKGDVDKKDGAVPAAGNENTKDVIKDQPSHSPKVVEPSAHEPTATSAPESGSASKAGHAKEVIEEGEAEKHQPKENEESLSQGVADRSLEDSPNSESQQKPAESSVGDSSQDENVRTSSSSKDSLPKSDADNLTSERRASDPVDPKEGGAAKPPRPQHRPELKPKPVPKPKPKNALASRFEAALRENEASKPKPVPRPKPKEGSAGSRISALQASMFANLNEALSRGPPPGGRPRFGSNDSQESHDEAPSAPAEQKVDANESAEAQLQAMPKNPRARAAGPRRAKRLPESAKPKFNIVTAEKPLWEIPARADKAPSSKDADTAESKEPIQHMAELTQPQVASESEPVAAAPEKEEASDESKAQPLKEEERKEQPGPESKGASHHADSDDGKPKDSSRPATAAADMDEEQERCAKEGLYAEPTVETRWIPDQISQAVPSKKPRKPEELADDGHVDSDDSARSGPSGGPNLGADTENDLRTALQRHLSHDSSEASSGTQSRGKDSNHAVTVEDLPPLGSLIDRVPSPPAADATSSRASLDTLMTPQRQREETNSASSLGVESLSQYLDKSPQAGAAPSGWDRMPASSKLDLGEAEGLLKDVKELKKKSEAEAKERFEAEVKGIAEAEERKKQANAEPSE